MTQLTAGGEAVVFDTRAAIEEQVLHLFAMISEGLAGATEAFLSEDREHARALIAADRAVDSLQADIERLINLELDGPVPPTPARTRNLIAILLIVLELERSGDLVEHIALRTAQGLAAELTPRARGLIQQMGDEGVEMWRYAAGAFAARDAQAAERLRSVDDRLDDLHVSLGTELAQCVISVPVAIEMGLVARFLERLGDHAVNVARRIAELPAGDPS
ncbi:MAG TPA: PhoU domain-containing protein [Acidimicrobiales bacterium]|nr:PhoU domain-containing protein [Acidimicrobiales bacterium]